MAKDLIHAAVRKALEKEGWKVLRDPFTIDLLDDDTYFDIDLSAEKPTDKRKVVRIAAIEIKSFTGLSILYPAESGLRKSICAKSSDDCRGMYFAIERIKSSDDSTP